MRLVWLAQAILGMLAFLVRHSILACISLCLPMAAVCP